MSTQDEAVEAMARAWVDTLAQRWCSRTWGQLSAKERRGYLDLAQAALTAALAVLQPTVPNKVEALDALPIGTVIRIDARAYVHSAAWEWVETVTGTAYTADELDAEAVIIYQPEEES